MSRPPMTFITSLSMASAPHGTMPGVCAVDYARHVLTRTALFSEAIIEGAALHLHKSGHILVKPEGWGAHRWNSLLWDIGVTT